MKCTPPERVGLFIYPERLICSSGRCGWHNANGFLELVLHKLPTCLFLIVTLLWAAAAQASLTPLFSSPKFSRVTVEDGLNQSWVRSLLVDKDGFLWIGTESGLNRYDGYQIQDIPGTNNELADTHISQLFQDKNGDIWVGVLGKGVFRIDLQSGKTSKLDVDLSDIANPWLLNPTRIRQDKQGNLWFLFVDRIVTYQPETGDLQVRFQLSEEQHQRGLRIRDFLHFGQRILLSGSEGLCWFDLQSRQLQSVAIGLSETGAVSMRRLFRYKDDVFVATNRGLLRLTEQALLEHATGQLPEVTAKVVAAGQDVLQLQEVSEGLLYFGSDRGLSRYLVEQDKVEWVFRPSEARYRIGADLITEIAVDHQGNLWLGSGGEGVYHWEPNAERFVNVSAKQGNLSDSHVWSMLETQDNQVWLGTERGINLYNFNSGQAQQFLTGKHPQAPQEQVLVLRIRQLDEQRLLLATNHGVLIFNTKRGEIEPLWPQGEQAKSLLTRFTAHVLVTSQGKVLIINDSGFGLYDPANNQLQMLDSLSERFLPDTVMCLLDVGEQFPGKYLLCEQHNLWLIDSDTFDVSLLHHLDGLSENHLIAVDSVQRDQQGNIWLAMWNYGLVGLDGKSFALRHHLSKANRLTTNSVYGVMSDALGNIWFSSNDGIWHLSPESLRLQKFGYHQGVEASEFNFYAYSQLADGRMLYGSYKGFTTFYPQLFNQSSSKAPEIAITSVDLTSRTLAMPLTNLSGQRITLEHQDLGLSIHFSSMGYQQKNAIQYQYQLTGSETIPYSETSESQVMFPRLEAGNYRFEVQSVEPYSGLTSDKATLHIHVKHAPWSSPLAYVFYALAASLLIFLWARGYKIRSLAAASAHAEALTSKNRLSLALDASNSGVWEYYQEDRSFVSDMPSKDLGYSQFSGGTVNIDTLIAFMHPDDKRLFGKRWRAFLRGMQDRFVVVIRFKDADDKWQWFKGVGNLVSQADQFVRVTGTYTNITESMANLEKVGLFGEAFKHTRDWVLILDRKRQAIACNPAFATTFGIDERQTLDTQVRQNFIEQQAQAPAFWRQLQELEGDKHWQGEDVLHIAGQEVCALARITPVMATQHAEEADHYLLIMSDITQQKAAEQALVRMANYDSLTNLPNRPLLVDRVKHAVLMAERHASSVALMFIDLDKFKQINDSLGHDAGDELLKVVAERLTDVLRRNDTVARLGGDEFVVLLEEVHQPERIQNLARDIIQKIEATINLGNQLVSVSASIGIALYPQDGREPMELLRHADIAMYHAKRQGRSRYQFFTEQMNAEARERMELENRLKQAHQNKRFLNYYQPIVDIEQQQICGFELLMRWPLEQGFISPDVFIPVAEEIGLIGDMTWQALHSAAPMLTQWHQAGYPVYLSVNLSARQFDDPLSIEKIISLLEIYELPVSALRFEITESALMSDYDKAQDYMREMREKGFMIALDDFGTGYSSLKYLKEFPIQVLKIDKSFVMDIGEDANDEAIVTTVLKMADSLGLHSVAEGIEKPAHIEFLSAKGCRYLQGYFFSRPVPQHQTLALLKQSWQQLCDNK